MEIYDKASWHIDGGENEKEVIERFRTVFEFLYSKNMLSADGEETLEFCMDSSVSLNDTMVNSEGNKFLVAFYDEIIKENEDLSLSISNAYALFLEKQK